MKKIIFTLCFTIISLNIFAQSNSDGEITNDLLGILIGGGILLFLVLHTKKWRNDNYSRKCPNCKTLVRPKTTAIRYHYTYKCPKCGCEF